MLFKYKTDNRTRSALAEERCKLDVRKHEFSQRTIHKWSRLQGECVNATSVNMCNNRIGNYDYDQVWGMVITGHSISHLASLLCAILGPQHYWDFGWQFS